MGEDSVNVRPHPLVGTVEPLEEVDVGVESQADVLGIVLHETPEGVADRATLRSPHGYGSVQKVVFLAQALREVEHERLAPLDLGEAGKRLRAGRLSGPGEGIVLREGRRALDLGKLAVEPVHLDGDAGGVYGREQLDFGPGEPDRLLGEFAHLAPELLALLHAFEHLDPEPRHRTGRRKGRVQRPLDDCKFHGPFAACARVTLRRRGRDRPDCGWCGRCVVPHGGFARLSDLGRHAGPGLHRHEVSDRRTFLGCRSAVRTKVLANTGQRAVPDLLQLIGFGDDAFHLALQGAEGDLPEDLARDRVLERGRVCDRRKCRFDACLHLGCFDLEGFDLAQKLVDLRPFCDGIDVVTQRQGDAVDADGEPRKGDFLNAVDELLFRPDAEGLPKVLHELRTVAIRYLRNERARPKGGDGADESRAQPVRILRRQRHVSASLQKIPDPGHLPCGRDLSGGCAQVARRPHVEVRELSEPLNDPTLDLVAQLARFTACWRRAPIGFCWSTRPQNFWRRSRALSGSSLSSTLTPIRVRFSTVG